MNAIIVDYKKNNYKNDRVEKYSNFKARDLLSKIEFVEQFDDMLPKPINFFENLYYFSKKLTDHEKVLFIIARLELNDITSYPRLIKEQLHTLKSKNGTNGSSDDLSYINRILKELEDIKRIRRIHECPNCGIPYSSQNKERFPDSCSCGHQFFFQENSFKKWSKRPYCLIELTGDGWEFLNKSTMSLLRASQFCIKWYEFLNEKLKQKDLELEGKNN